MGVAAFGKTSWPSNSSRFSNDDLPAFTWPTTPSRRRRPSSIISWVSSATLVEISRRCLEELSLPTTSLYWSITLIRLAKVLLSP